MGRFARWHAIILALGLALAACGSPGRGDVTPASTPQAPQGRIIAPRSDISLDDVYRQMEQAIAQTGKVFHARMRVASFQSTFPTPTLGSGNTAADVPNLTGSTTEAWLDTATASGRLEYNYASSVGRLIVTRDETLLVADGRSQGTSSLRCRGSDSPLLARLMGCGNYIEKSQTTVHSGEYGGRSAVVLVTEGVSPDSDSSYPFKATLYLDSATWLPVAYEDDESLGSEHISYSTAYETGFVDRTALAPDFFEPASIGYVERDPEEPLRRNDPGIPIYWLGASFKATGGLPELVLHSSGVVMPNPTLPRLYRATLEYASASDKRGAPLIGLQEFAPAEWDSLFGQSHGGNIWDGVQPDRIALPGGYALLFRIPASYGERYLAQVFVPETVILVMDFDAPSPYNTREGFEAVIHGLAKR
jgi:hypothetical protein